MKKHFNTCKEYEYKGFYIYKITNKDYCVFNENGVFIDSFTLKGAKAEIDKIVAF